MRKSLAIVLSSLVLAALSLSVFVGSPQAAEDAQSVRTFHRWEYRQGGHDAMENLGAQGWEAYAVIDRRNEPVTIYFKRPKQ